MKKILLLSVLALGLPFAAFAATYDYVNTTGGIQSVQADTPDQAFAEATNIDPHSGVALDIGSFASVSDPTYEYVTTYGTTALIEASDPAQAFANATNIAPNSGVMLVSD